MFGISNVGKKSRDVVETEFNPSMLKAVEELKSIRIRFHKTSEPTGEDGGVDARIE